MGRIALLLCLVALCDTARLSLHASPPRLKLRGGGEQPEPVTPSQISEPVTPSQISVGNQTSKEIWENVYMVPGFSSICEDRFELETIGKCLESDREGLRVTNKEAGASSARTRRVMRYGDHPKMYYFEAELIGGGPPVRIPGWKGLYLDGDDGEKVWFSAEDICGDGTKGAAIGIVAGGALTCFDNSTTPDDCFVWYASGMLRWPWAYNEWEDIDNTIESPLTALSDLLMSPQTDANAFRSGDRYGVLVDFHTNKLGFFRNGELVPEFSRSLSPHVPPMVLRFMVGGVRPDTTWTICSQAQGMATLEQLDWREWVSDLNPNCVDWRPEQFVKESCSPGALADYQRHMKDYVDMLKREGRRE